MNRRDIRFGASSPYRGWNLAIDQARHGEPILVQIQTAPTRALPRQLSAAMVLRRGTPAHTAAQAGMNAGPGSPLEHTLTAILADLPDQAAAYGATPFQHASIGLISAAGVHARREWAERYPEGVPAFEVIGEVSADTLAAMLAAEDAAEDDPTSPLAPDDRATCHGCRALATKEHLDSEQHRRGPVAVVAAVAGRSTDEYDRPSFPYYSRRPNTSPHNEYGTTDDFYG